MQNLPELLKSKRFWTLFITLVVLTVFPVVGLNLDLPTATIDTIATLMAGVGGLTVGAYAIEDFIEAWKQHDQGRTAKAAKNTVAIATESAVKAIQDILPDQPKG